MATIYESECMHESVQARQWPQERREREREREREMVEEKDEKEDRKEVTTTLLPSLTRLKQPATDKEKETCMNCQTR